jgi:hypothetical protein
MGEWNFGVNRIRRVSAYVVVKADQNERQEPLPSVRQLHRWKESNHLAEGQKRRKLSATPILSFLSGNRNFERLTQGYTKGTMATMPETRERTYTPSAPTMEKVSQARPAWNVAIFKPATKTP